MFYFNIVDNIEDAGSIDFVKVTEKQWSSHPDKNNTQIERWRARQANAWTDVKTDVKTIKGP